MGRPIKTGLDYFPLDVNLDSKMKLIKAEFGMIGFGIVIRLYQCIYGEEGYYMDWSQDVALMFADQERVGVNVVSEVVAACLRRGIFDKEKYETRGILTSRGIQKRYLKMTEKRIESKISDEYILLSVPKKTVNPEETLVSDGRNSVNSTGKYTKESKVNKSKVNKTNIDSSSLLDSSKRSENQNDVDQKPAPSTSTTTPSLFELFEDEFGRPLTQREMQILSDWCNRYDLKLIKYALKEAMLYRRVGVDYVNSILQTWTSKGFKPEDIESGEYLFKNRNR